MQKILFSRHLMDSSSLKGKRSSCLPPLRCDAATSTHRSQLGGQGRPSEPSSDRRPRICEHEVVRTWRLLLDECCAVIYVKGNAAVKPNILASDFNDSRIITDGLEPRRLIHPGEKPLGRDTCPGAKLQKSSNLPSKPYELPVLAYMSFHKQRLEKQVLDMDWLPPVKARSPRN